MDVISDDDDDDDIDSLSAAPINPLLTFSKIFNTTSVMITTSIHINTLHTR